MKKKKFLFHELNEWLNETDLLEFNSWKIMIKTLLKTKRDTKNLDHCWYQRFLIKHSDFRTKYSRNLNQIRKNVDNVEIIKNWFNLYSFIKTQYRIVDRDIYNMNEKKFVTSIANNIKILIKTSMIEAFNVNSVNQDWISLIECVSFSRLSLSTYFIFQNSQIQQAWIDIIENKNIIVKINSNE